MSSSSCDVAPGPPLLPSSRKLWALLGKSRRQGIEARSRSQARPGADDMGNANLWSSCHGAFRGYLIPTICLEYLELSSFCDQYITDKDKTIECGFVRLTIIFFEMHDKGIIRFNGLVLVVSSKHVKVSHVLCMWLHDVREKTCSHVTQVSIAQWWLTFFRWGERRSWAWQLSNKRFRELFKLSQLTHCNCENLCDYFKWINHLIIHHPRCQIVAFLRSF